MDIATIATLVGTGIAIVGFNYTFLRNFKDDIKEQMDRHDDKLEKTEERIENLDSRMFQVLTGKKLEDAILEEKKEKRPRE